MGWGYSSLVIIRSWAPSLAEARKGVPGSYFYISILPPCYGSNIYILRPKSFCQKCRWQDTAECIHPRPYEEAEHTIQAVWGAIYHTHELTCHSSGTLIRNTHLRSLSHCGLIHGLKRVEFVCMSWSPLKKERSVGRKWSVELPP